MIHLTLILVDFLTSIIIAGAWAVAIAGAVIAGIIVAGVLMVRAIRRRRQ